MFSNTFPIHSELKIENWKNSWEVINWKLKMKKKNEFEFWKLKGEWEKNFWEWKMKKNEFEFEN